MKSINAKNVRGINRGTVLALMRGGRTAGTAELAALSGLSVATCAGILAEFVAEGIFLELPERGKSGGRPARRYAYNPACLAVAAIAVEAVRGGAVISCSVADALGSVVDSVGAGVDGGGGAAEKGTTGRAAPVVRAVPEALDSVLEKVRGRHPALRAVSVSVPGVVRDGAIGMCDVAELSGIALARRIEAAHGVRAAVENDVNFAALGYPRTAGAVPSDGGGLAFLYFPKGNPPGAGLIVNGSLVRGKSCFAGEIAFIPVSGASGSSGSGGSGGAEKHIARLVASVTAVVNPGIVVLGGAGAREEMLPEIRRHCLSMIPPEHLPELTARPGFGECRLAGMIGAALEAAQERGDARDAGKEPGNV